MITVSTTAAEQIKNAAKQGNMLGMPLRIAAQKAPDGQLQYAMGFADDQNADDLKFESEGITVVVAPGSYGLLRDTELDFVTLDDGQTQFIFKNPNDPNYQPSNSSGEHHF